MEAWIPSSCQTLLNLNNNLMNRSITKKVRGNITEQPHVRINKNRCERLDYCLFDYSLVWDFQSNWKYPYVNVYFYIDVGFEFTIAERFGRREYSG